MTFYPNFLKYFDNQVSINYDYCIDSPYNNISLYEKWDPVEDYGFINIYINLCYNMTGGPKCKSKEVIDWQLSRLFANFANIDYCIDNKNTTLPQQIFGIVNTFSISNTVNKWINVRFKNIEYETYQGFVFQVYRKTEY